MFRLAIYRWQLGPCSVPTALAGCPSYYSHIVLAGSPLILHQYPRFRLLFAQRTVVSYSLARSPWRSPGAYFCCFVGTMRSARSCSARCSCHAARVASLVVGVGGVQSFYRHGVIVIVIVLSGSSSPVPGGGGRRRPTARSWGSSLANASSSSSPACRYRLSA